MMTEAAGPDDKKYLAVDDTNAVESLFRSCASIRRRTRTCLTLSNNPSEAAASRKRNIRAAAEDSSEYYARRIREEKLTAAELDRKILDYRSAILRQKHKRQKLSDDDTTQQQQQAKNDKAATKAATQQYRQARSKLFDETLRQQQESLLLKRISMSQPAVETAFVVHSNGSSSGDMDRRILLQEAVKCRNRQATKVLETQRKLDKVKRQLVLESEAGQTLQQQNRELWKELQTLRAQKQQHTQVILTATGNSNDSSTNNNNSKEEQRLAAENVILKRVLADIISGSGGLLDWYNDKQLRETFLQLEH